MAMMPISRPTAGFAHVFLCVGCLRQRRIEEPLAGYAMIPCECGAWAYVVSQRVQQYKPLIPQKAETQAAKHWLTHNTGPR